MEFFESMPLVLRTFWYIALPVSLVFIIQTLMTFIGADASDGIDADFDGDFDGEDAPFQLFSLRNLINFLLGLSWGGITLYDSIPHTGWLITVAATVGLVFLFAFLFIIKQIESLAEDNSFKIYDALGKTAEVYIPIPAKTSGKGKVLVSVKGSVHELEAITRDEEKIPTGSMVKVSALEAGSILIVEKF